MAKDEPITIKGVKLNGETIRQLDEIAEKEGITREQLITLIEKKHGILPPKRK